jgi:hypothetical protein
MRAGISKASVVAKRKNTKERSGYPLKVSALNGFYISGDP